MILNVINYIIYARVTLCFSLLISLLSALFIINQSTLFKLNFVHQILKNKSILYFAIFCIICSRYFFDINKLHFKLYVIYDTCVLIFFVLIRILPQLAPKILYHLPLNLVLLLSFLAICNLILRSIIKFGAFLDLNKNIDLAGGNPEIWNIIIKNVFKQTINQIPKQNPETGSRLSVMAKATLGVGIVTAGFTGALLYETHLSRLNAERETDRNLLKDNVITPNQYYDRWPKDRPPKV